MSDLVEVPQTLVEDITTLVERLCNAPTPIRAAQDLIELNNEVSQLATWHPRFNERTGYIDALDFDNLA